MTASPPTRMWPGQLIDLHFYTRLWETEKSERMLAEFKNLHQQEADDSAAADEDASKESDPR
jgi:hypothetical protein